jgi:hypothetical protein
MNDSIVQAQAILSSHPVYASLRGPRELARFMESHVFAVWDFMSLLKSLQRRLSCVELPWRPMAVDKRLTRLVNEIVLGEESDLDPQGRPMDHYTLYRMAMDEVGARGELIDTFVETLDFSPLSPAVAKFTRTNLLLAMEAPLEEVAAAFFFGREKLIPGMFTGLLGELNRTGVDCPLFKYYIERHIELDGDHHGALAHECLELLTQGDPKKLERAYQVGLESLELRCAVWDEVLCDLNTKSTSQCLSQSKTVF